MGKDTFFLYLDKIHILCQIKYLDTIQILFWPMYLDKIQIQILIHGLLKPIHILDTYFCIDTILRFDFVHVLLKNIGLRMRRVIHGSKLRYQKYKTESLCINLGMIGFHFKPK